MDKRLKELRGELPDADRYSFYRFADLQRDGIVSSRYDLHIKIRERGFPKPLKDAPTMQAIARWRRSEVRAWLDRQYPDASLPDIPTETKPTAQPRRRARKAVA